MSIKIGWANEAVAYGGSATHLPNEIESRTERDQILERRVRHRVKVALQEQLEFGNTNVIVTEDEGRGLSPTSSARDLSRDNQDKVYQQAYYIYKTNPLAFASLEIMTDFVVGEGFGIEAHAGAESKIQKEFDKFWFNPNNNWDIRQENKVRELGLYGVQYLPLKVDEFTGRTTTGYIDPTRVEDIAFKEGNTEIIDKLQVRSNRFGTDPKIMQVVQEVADPESDAEEGKTILQGEVFYFNVNRVSNAKFGTSDLLCSLEWMDIYDQFLFSAAERALLQESHVWHYQWEGLTPDEIDAKSRRYRKAPKPGSSRHTNEKVTITALGPQNTGNANTKVMADLLKMYSIMGMRLPEHWLSDGGDVNFATAKAMGTPIFKRLRRRQKLWVSQFNLMWRFIAENLLRKDMITQEEFDAGWTVTVPPISVEDAEGAAKTLTQVATSLATGEASDWITKDEAATVYRREATKLGIDMDFEDSKLPSEREEEETDDDQDDTEQNTQDEEDAEREETRADSIFKNRSKILAELEAQAA